MTVEVPSDASRARRIAFAVAGAILGFGLLAVFVWAATRGPQAQPTQSTIEPAEQTSESTSSPGMSTTETSEPSVEPSKAAPPTGKTPAATPSPRIAFVLGGRIYVSDPDGSNAVAVAPQGGAYSLSPDGSTLAVVTQDKTAGGTAGTVSLFDTTRGTLLSVGSQALGSPPAWSPDSSWLVFTSGTADTLISRVSARGGTPTQVARPGTSPSVSRDGAFIAYARSDGLGLGGPLYVVPSDGGKSLPVDGGTEALSWDWGPSGTLYFSRPGVADGTWDLWKAKVPELSVSRVGSLALEAPRSRSTT